MGMRLEKCLYSLSMESICCKPNVVVWGCVFSVKLRQSSSHVVSSLGTRGHVGTWGYGLPVGSQGLQSGEWNTQTNAYCQRVRSPMKNLKLYKPDSFLKLKNIPCTLTHTSTLPPGAVRL